MFNLENSVKQWLRQFRKQRAFDHGNIREMELHLRDHIDDLVADGISEEAAFNKAVEEFGEIPDMAEEEYLNLKRNNNNFNPIIMYRNYFKVALRSFTKQPFFTFLNTFGLAVGMAGALLIALFIYDEISFDRMFADADRIYRINIDNQTNGEYSEYAAAPGPMAAVLDADCSHIQLVTRFRRVSSALLRKPDENLNIKETNVAGADSAMFDMFGLTLLEGDTKTALKEPYSIVLTKTAAKSHFGDKKALGQSLILDNKDTYIVTGVLDDLPRNSFIRNYTVFISMSSFEDENTPAWNTWYFPTFVKLQPGSKEEDLEAFLNTVKESYLIPWAMTFIPGLTIENSRKQEEETGNFMRFNAIALTDIHLHSSNRRVEFSENSDINNVYILSFIGLFLILMASVNFMNLSTAYSLKRAKEVGIRKTLGSDRLGLIRQFLTESVLISFLSMVLAIVLASVAIPFFNQLAGKGMAVPFREPFFWVILFIATMILGLVSGSYPAFFLSKFIPAKVLKGGQTEAGGKTIRNSLVVLQFSISIFLILGTMVIFQQVNYIKNKDLGFQKDQILVLDDVNPAGQQLQSFKEKVKQVASVENVSLSSYLPTPSSRGGTAYFSEGAIEDQNFDSGKALIIEAWDVDHDYLATLNLELVSGRDFDIKRASDSSAVILNETAIEMLEVSPNEAIGMRLTSDFHRDDKENMAYMTVIGVVKNFHFESLRKNIDALSINLGGNPNKMMIKLNAGNFQGSISQIEELWDALETGLPFNYYFMDESFNSTYRAELRLGSIFIAFTSLSIIIACLGLFGLAAFNAEKKAKEIGIRKVMGASVRQITYKLSYDFLKLVLISVVVALPLGWWAMDRWLQEFTFRIEIGWWLLALAAILAITISLLTVSYQSIKAAISNPVKSLRSE